MTMKPIVVLGAGVAGLAAGRRLAAHGNEVLVIEKDARVGGLAQTDSVGGFLFDRTGHFLHFKSPHLLHELEQGGVALAPITRRAAVIVGKQAVSYPIQYNLWELTQSNRDEVLRDLKDHGRPAARVFANFDDYLESAWGRALCQLFFRPYNEKLWGRSLESLPPDCAGRYLPSVDLSLLKRGCSVSNAHYGYNSEFYYPVSGRIGDCTDALAAPIRHNVHLNERVIHVDSTAGICYTRSGGAYRFSQLVSTIPLPSLLSLLNIPLPRSDLFSCTRVVNVRVGFRGRICRPFHWIYIPTPEVPFYRIGFPGNVNERACPPGCASISIECTVNEETASPEPNDVADLALAYLQGIGLIELGERLCVDHAVIEPAYVVFRSPGRQFFQDVARELERANIHVAGRYGAWDYLSMEESYSSGQLAAERAMEARGG